MMSEDATKPSRFWSLVGKMGTVLGAVWLLIQLYSYFSHKEYNLTAYGEVSEVDFPNEFKMGKTRKTKLFSNPEGDFIAAYMFLIHVENRGTKEVRDIKLELPFKGYYRIGDSEESPPFEEVISVDSIRPSNSLDIRVWVRELLMVHDGVYFQEEGIKFTHPNGVVRVDFSRRARGMLALLAEPGRGMGVLISLCALVIAMLAGGGLFWISCRHRTEQRELCDDVSLSEKEVKRRKVSEKGGDEGNK